MHAEQRPPSCPLKSVFCLWPRPIILLVEDDILVRHPLADYLRECGFTVVEAVNGAEAKAVISSLGPF